MQSLIFYKQLFFQLSLSVAEVFHKLSFKCCLGSSRTQFGLSSSKKICVVCFIKSPLKMIKNALHFILKDLFVLKIFKFLS